MFSFRKILTAGVIASTLAGGFVATSTTPAAALWLVRGMPLHVGVVHYRRHYYGYHYGFRRSYRLYGRNLHSGFFPSCAGTYGVPIC